MKGRMRCGTSLLECITYLLITVLVTNICCVMLSAGYRFFVEHARRARQLAEVYTAADLFARDIRSAPSGYGCWKVLHTQELVWLQGVGALGWLYKKNKLWRVSGTYDEMRGTWSKKAKTLVARKLESCRFLPRRRFDRGNEGIAAFDLELASDTTVLTLSICTRAGIVL